MKLLLLAIPALILALTSYSRTIIVKNLEELHAASKNALPGDVIILKNGEWKDVQIKLESIGTKEKPIIYKAEKPGGVIITGNSRLALGGEYMEVQGLLFTRGYSGDKAVIEFRTSKDKLANHCRVTGSAIDAFNNSKRMDENYWVAFYGKNNRLDHCSFKNKNNIGVLLAVILDDDRSRENFHRIDHNYFGTRMPLASNGGEIIRVGVSQHCQFNSNTQITDNFFENCDGETEIVSIKSGSNMVKGNLFKECQGSVVLRHGDNNTVENNIFLGNGKPGTGGVRVINKGQWVVNNFFYKCRGVDFRSPLAIMNGIVNSPANRYVQVTDAVIANNTFMECSPISFCEGSDAERTLPPENVLLLNNLVYNSIDTTLFNVYDHVRGFKCSGNELNSSAKNKKGTLIDNCFIKRKQALNKGFPGIIPVSQVKAAVRLPDSIRTLSFERLGKALSTKPGYTNIEFLKESLKNAQQSTGANWFKSANPDTVNGTAKTINCATAEDIYKAVKTTSEIYIQLTAEKYHFSKPVEISSTVGIGGLINKTITFSTDKIKSVIILDGGAKLYLANLKLDASKVKSENFFMTAESGSSDHTGIMMSGCTISNLDRKNGCENFFKASKSLVSDIISFNLNSFINNKVHFLMMGEEKDNKGYYNAEFITIKKNRFINMEGTLLNIYRGGNDESTLGPNLVFSNNTVQSVTDKDPLIQLTGVQVSEILSNSFTNSNKEGVLIKYIDIVRARHYFKKNQVSQSGKIESNQYFIQ